MRTYFFVNGRPVDYSEGKKMFSNYFKIVFHRSDVLGICYIQIPKKTFEVADTSKRTIYFSNKLNLLKVIESQLKEIYNLDEESIDFKKKSLNDSVSSNSSTNNSMNSTKSSITTPSKSSNSNLSTPRSESEIKTPQSRISTPNESPIPKRKENISEIDSDFEDDFLEPNLPSPKLDSIQEPKDSDDLKEDSPKEVPKVLKNFEKPTNVKPSFYPNKNQEKEVEKQKEPEKEVDKPKNQVKEVEKSRPVQEKVVNSKPSPEPKEFSRHYVDKTVNRPVVELGLSTPVRQVNNRLLSEPFTRVSSSQPEVSKTTSDIPRFSQECIKPRERIEETFYEKPKKDDPSPKKRKMDEKEKKEEEGEEFEEEDDEEDFIADITQDIILDQYLEFKTKSSQIEYKKFYQDHSITRELIDGSELIGNISWKNYDDIKILKTNEKNFISLFSFESLKLEQKLIFDNLMKNYKFTPQLLDEPLNVSDIIPREFIIFKNIFKFNGFLIQENSKNEIELNACVSRDILPCNFKDDLSEIVSKLVPDFEKVKNEAIDINELENDLTFFRTTKIIQFFEKNSKKLSKKKTIRECEDQLNNLVKSNEIPKSLFKYQISLYEEDE